MKVRTTQTAVAHLVAIHEYIAGDSTRYAARMVDRITKKSMGSDGPHEARCGKMGWRACYFKEVDATEKTLRFWQAIYDSQGRLVEIHEKFPVDLGHRPIQDSQQ